MLRFRYQAHVRHRESDYRPNQLTYLQCWPRCYFPWMSIIAYLRVSKKPFSIAISESLVRGGIPRFRNQSLDWHR
ncbi:hypothetical protein EAF04_006372 [Stromatinia cepivora]|nr:hypothetical protein EAF04_006372 [Stromatinia cepivora]